MGTKQRVNSGIGVDRSLLRKRPGEYTSVPGVSVHLKKQTAKPLYIAHCLLPYLPLHSDGVRKPVSKLVNTVTLVSNRPEWDLSGYRCSNHLHTRFLTCLVNDMKYTTSWLDVNTSIQQSSLPLSAWTANNKRIGRSKVISSGTLTSKSHLNGWEGS